MLKNAELEKKSALLLTAITGLAKWLAMTTLEGVAWGEADRLGTRALRGGLSKVDKWTGPKMDWMLSSRGALDRSAMRDAARRRGMSESVVKEYLGARSEK